MKRKVIIRADGNTAVGMGHVIRCLALAEMLKPDHQVIFALQHPGEMLIKAVHSVTETIFHLPAENDHLKDADNLCEFLERDDIVVLDGYEFRTAYQEKIKAKGCLLVAVDDLHAWHHVADIVINHAAGVRESEYSKETYTKLLLGPDHALLRKDFLKTDSVKRERTAVKVVFIGMGGSDVNNLSLRFCEILQKISTINKIHLTIGPANPHLDAIRRYVKKQTQNVELHVNISSGEMMKLLRQCDLAISPASGTALECCALGTPLLVGISAENQKGIRDGILAYNAGFDLGDLRKITEEELIAAIQVIDKGVLDELSANQRKMIDGRSPERIRAAFSDLLKEKLHFRMANASDVDFYYIWTNDPLVRANSYHQSSVKYDDHVNWFNNKLASGNCFFYLFLNKDEKAVGQVRIDKGEKETVIGISVDPGYRGKGFAAEMLNMATNDYLQKNPGTRIAAYIKKENTASYNSFLKAGFGKEEIVMEQGTESYKLYKEA